MKDNRKRISLKSRHLNKLESSHPFILPHTRLIWWPIELKGWSLAGYYPIPFDPTSRQGQSLWKYQYFPNRWSFLSWINFNKSIPRDIRPRGGAKTMVSQGKRKYIIWKQNTSHQASSLIQLLTENIESETEGLTPTKGIICLLQTEHVPMVCVSSLFVRPCVLLPLY